MFKLIGNGKTTPHGLLSFEGDLHTLEPIASVWVEKRKRWLLPSKHVLQLDYESGDGWEWEFDSPEAARATQEHLLEALQPIIDPEGAPNR